MNDLPGVSVVIATLNAARYLNDCLTSIRAQSYPQELLEIIVADGGSQDDTLAIAAQHGVDRVLPNELKTGEAGKAIALRAATRELILSLDADNYLVGDDWLRRVVQPLLDHPDVFGAEAIRWHYRRSDAAANRYFMLLGVTEPVSIFLGNYGHLSQVTGRWTGYRHVETEENGYLIAEFEPDWVPTLGANGFVVRASVIREIGFTDYYFDVDAVVEMVRQGHRKLAKVDVEIGHQFVRDLRTYRRKQQRRIQDFLYWRDVRDYPWLRDRTRGVIGFTAATVTVVPLLVQVRRGYRRVPDRAWLYHVPACWITLLLYGWNVIAARRRSAPHSREGWAH